MAISRQDRALIQSLREAENRLANAQPGNDRTGALRAVVAQLVAEARQTLSDAVATEDQEDTEAQAAAQARQDAFDAVRAAYGRLYAGLTAGAALAVMRGEEGPEARKLRVYLGSDAPSKLAESGLGQIRATVEAARVFVDRFIPEADRDALKQDVDQALAAADAAEKAYGKESVEAVEARTALFRARESVRVSYLAARDLLSGALRLEGAEDRLNVMLPPYERFRVLSRSGGAEDGGDGLPSADALPELPPEPDAVV